MVAVEQRTKMEWMSDVIFALMWLPETRHQTGNKVSAVDRVRHFQGTVESVDVLRGLVEIKRTDGSGQRIKIRGSHAADEKYSRTISF